MDKLSPEDLHLLLDEPIYVLADHGDHPIDSAVNEDQPEYNGSNEKGICIFVGDADEDDLLFLFKGLNALDIEEKDVAIYHSDFDALKEYPTHSKRLRFSTHVNIETAFDIRHSSELSSLESIPIKEIRNNQDFKRKFWEALKVIFKA